MGFTRDRSNNLLFSLHDSRVKKFTFKNRVLILKMEKKHTPEKLSLMIVIWMNVVF